MGAAILAQTLVVAATTPHRFCETTFAPPFAENDQRLRDAGLDLGVTPDSLERILSDENTRDRIRATTIAQFETRNLEREFWQRVKAKLKDPKYSTGPRRSFSNMVGWFLTGREPKVDNPLLAGRQLLVRDIEQEMGLSLSPETRQLLIEHLCSYPAIEQFVLRPEVDTMRLTSLFVKESVPPEIRRSWLRRSYKLGTIKIHVNGPITEERLATLVNKMINDQSRVDGVFIDLYRKSLDQIILRNPFTQAFLADLTTPLLDSFDHSIAKLVSTAIREKELATSMVDYLKFILDPRSDDLLQSGNAKKTSIATEFQVFLTREAKGLLKVSRPVPSAVDTAVNNVPTVVIADATIPVAVAYSQRPIRNRHKSRESEEQVSSKPEIKFNINDLSPKDKMDAIERACLNSKVFAEFTALLDELEPSTKRLAIDSTVMLEAGVPFRDVPHTKSLVYHATYEIKLNGTGHRIYFTLGPKGFKVLAIGLNIKNNNRMEAEMILQVSRMAQAFHSSSR